MLTCPYCQKPVLEDSPSCPACSLSLQGANALLGPVPLLNRGLTDTTETLSDREKRSLKRAIAQLERTFPQSHLNIVLRHLEPKFNLSTHLFWLFNTAGLSPQEAKNEQNQDILLGLDPSNGRIGLMVGYGLEPFVPSEAITQLLECARTELEEGQFADALQLLVRKLIVLLTNASQQAHKALGTE